MPHTLTDAERAALAPFAGVTLDDAGLAAAAEVPPEAVAAWRVEQAGGPPAAPEKPAKARRSRKAAAAADPEPVAPQEADETPVEPPAEPQADRRAEPAAKPESAPGCVRVTVGSAHLPNWCGTGKPKWVRFRDAYRGDEAAWLWTHHREIVERYPR